jgi:multidrug resistance efflux pump
MSEAAISLPVRRPDLVSQPLGERGPYVVKNPATGEYYHLGEEEHFLLMQLDGEHSALDILGAFQDRFGQPLTAEDFAEFLEMVQAQGLVQTVEAPGLVPGRLPSPRRQSILYWRKALCDPDRLFSWLAPKLWFFWTGGFLLLSSASVLLAVLLLWANRHELTGNFTQALRWETAVWAWLILLVVAALHESAHGLTCKHYGGEVHEIGFLLMVFLPCFYCNVSDSWLFREKSKRLWVMFAGGWFELFLWSLAVFVWRLALPGTLPHTLAFAMLSLCGIQTLFNFLPLLKLDGYYMLSDWLEVPNLHQRALERFKGQLRRLLWGAPPPAPDPRGRLLCGFGLAVWLYLLVVLTLLFVSFLPSLWSKLGWPGLLAGGLLALLSTRGVLRGVTGGEVWTMFRMRYRRTLGWGLILGGLAAVLCLVEMEDRASGSFRLRPAVRAELRASIAGFLTEVWFDEGDRVAAGSLVARLEAPELATRWAQKQAEVREAQAKLQLLESGPRAEEIEEQGRRVVRAVAWRDLGREDLKRLQAAHAEDLARLDRQVAVCQAEHSLAQECFERAAGLVRTRAVPDEQYREAEAKSRISKARLEEALAARRACQAKGTLEAEAEVARRDKDLADAEATLRLLRAGTRLEEIEAERARLARLQEEARHLYEQRQKQAVVCPVCGLVTTARLKEKVGQFLREGDVLCVVEEPACLEAEITLAEQDLARVRPGQEVQLKARALPCESFASRVERIAPAAGRGEVQSSVLVCCRLEAPPEELRPEMTGYARVFTGRRPIGLLLVDRVVRFLRTEFWW